MLIQALTDKFQDYFAQAEYHDSVLWFDQEGEHVALLDHLVALPLWRYERRLPQPRHHLIRGAIAFRTVGLFLCILLLTACGLEPTPTPDLVGTRVAVQQAAAATLTAIAPTATNTPTMTPRPTATRTPSPTPTPRPTISGVRVIWEGDGDIPAWSLAAVRTFVNNNSTGLGLGVAGGFLLGIVVASICFIRQNRRMKKSGQAQAEELYRNAQSEIKSLKKAHRAEVNRLEQECRAQVEQLEQKHQMQINDLSTANWQSHEEKRLQRWLEMLRNAPWSKQAPEVEIETKFLFPLLRFLGYEECDMEMRTSIAVQQGTTQNVIQADLVVRNAAQQAMLVVEAKAPCCELGEPVRRQAQSYALQLGAPAYLLSNGYDLQIYHRGVIEDRCVLACHTSKLKEHWKAVEEAAAKDRVAALRTSLIGSQQSR